ncbi:unnamed protein product [Lactuca saligna]|uniref:Malectin domain-containing protein n=1 Tax=Lactuca saligna TaxID=75948 RepID=A0AA35V4B6_LACSI|nr:unnamed protein product [Lactuca saligna]
MLSLIDLDILSSMIRDIQGSGLEGPIPVTVSLLKNLTQLISDLNGNSSKYFPDLRNMTGVEQLDLSFNNLEGDIPDLKELDMEKMYLTSNSLNGNACEIDLSYNKFKEESVPLYCRENLYLFRSYAAASNSELGKCLSWFPVERDSGGAAKFVPTRDFWGTSSTGNALGNNHRLSNYVATNVSAPTIDDSKLYTTARLFPLSITYYVRCLPNGNYTVTLHFAEIVFRDNVFSESWNTFVLCIYSCN